MAVPLSATAAEKWFLMARHGECSEVSSLKRKVLDLGDVNDPHAFSTLMRQKGYQVTGAEYAVPRGKGYEVKVPEQSLYLIFVTSEMCSKSAKG